jgi:ABC-type multidrug transport system ATPase subunit
MSTLLAATELTKQFTGVRAVDRLSFSVNEGEVYGFLGQNGAGKSTTIRMLLTLIRPTSGSIQVFGQKLETHRLQILRRIGAIIEKPDLYKYLSAYHNLRLFARLSGLRPTEKQLMQQLEKVGLSDRAHSRVRTFSQGMKQRLGIACALIHDPRLIILDEPTNGLDPQGIADMRNLILHLSRNEGRTVMVSSHLLSEIELIADSMLIIDKGRKVVEGKVSELLDPAGTLVEVRTADDRLAKEKLSSTRWASFLQNDERILLKMHSRSVPELNQELVNMGIPVLSLVPRHSLEDYFLSLTTGNQHVAAYKD